MRIVFPLLVLSLLLLGCIKNNEDPVWVEIDTWDLLVNPNSSVDPQSPHYTGVLTSNISDAWVFMDGELVGVFELPVKIPILTKSGTHTFKIFPTILNNGISATKKIYPFLEPYILTVELEQNKTTKIMPETRYYAQTKFWIEDFEDQVVSISDGTTSSTSIEKVSDPAVLDNEINEGAFGRVNLDATNFFWTGSTTANLNSLVMDLPIGQEVYLEIDYHNTNNLVTGLLNIQNSGAVRDNINIRLNEQEEGQVRWKKIYIDLRELVSSSTDVSYFEFSFQAFLDGDDMSGQINIDNIKAVYF